MPGEKLLLELSEFKENKEAAGFPEACESSARN